MRPELDLIEACYEPIASDHEWARNLACRFQPLLVAGEMVVCMGAVTAGDALEVAAPAGTPAAEDLIAAGQGPLRVAEEVSAHRLGSQLMQTILGDRAVVVNVASELPAPMSSVLRAALPGTDSDAVAVLGRVGPHETIMTAQAFPRGWLPSASQRQLLVRLGGHMRVAKLLRNQLGAERQHADPARAAAVFSPRGNLRHRGDAIGSETLRTLADAVVDLDRARRRQTKTAVETSELWRATVAGKYSLVEVFERDGKRHILAVETGLPPRPRLTPREQQVAELVAKGYSNKVVGSELGITGSTVAVHLASALRKLGIPNRCFLVSDFGPGQGTLPLPRPHDGPGPTSTT